MTHTADQTNGIGPLRFYNSDHTNSTPHLFGGGTGHGASTPPGMEIPGLQQERADLLTAMHELTKADGSGVTCSSSADQLASIQERLATVRQDLGKLYGKIAVESGMAKAGNTPDSSPQTGPQASSPPKVIIGIDHNRTGRNSGKTSRRRKKEPRDY